MTKLAVAALIATTTVACAPAPASPQQAIIDALGGDASFGVRLARCESTLNPTARNGTHIGLFQLAKRYHETRARRLGFTWSQMTQSTPNAVVAHDLFREQGRTPWLASRQCWS